jgi:hypothetical protein
MNMPSFEITLHSFATCPQDLEPSLLGSPFCPRLVAADAILRGTNRNVQAACDLGRCLFQIREMCSLSSPCEQPLIVVATCDGPRPACGRAELAALGRVLASRQRHNLPEIIEHGRVTR